jgi:hypothetical protein
MTSLPVDKATAKEVEPEGQAQEYCGSHRYQPKLGRGDAKALFPDFLPGGQAGPQPGQTRRVRLV